MIKCFKYNDVGILFLVLYLLSGVIQAQTSTVVTGTILDAQTKEPLSFVDIIFQHTNSGAFSAIDGTFVLETQAQVNAIVVSYVGYEKKIIAITPGKKQDILVKLTPMAAALEAVTVKEKKQRYSKKNNPAVDLMRKVIEHKKANGLNGHDYYQYQQYEKVEVDVNHLSEKFRKRKVFKNFGFIWNYLDSTDISIEPFLPILLRETNATIYHHAASNNTKEYIHAIKTSKLDEAADQNNLNETINTMYQDVDIYENNIVLLKNQFLSPIAPLAIDFYRFYIVDTVEIAEKKAIRLSFIPRNQANFGFTGHLYISQDEQYQVLKVEMGLFGNVNLNFVQDIKIEQEFQAFDTTFVLKKNSVIIDYALQEEGIGLLGTKTVYYDAYSFAAPSDLSIFDGIERTIVAVDAEKKDAAYWSTHRMVPLTKSEEGIYQLVDTLANNPAFQRFQKVSNILIFGYIPAGKIDIGPYGNMISSNSVEGLRLKFGGETNLKFGKKWLIQGYGAYGLRDQTFKYAGHVYYSFNENYLQSPRHFIHLNYVKETGFPGMEQDVISENNVFQSFRWGRTDKMLLFHTFRVENVRETKSFTYGISFTTTSRAPYGTLVFEQIINDLPVVVERINTSEIGFDLRFAPNQQFTISGKKRIPIYNKYPIFTLGYDVGIKDFLGGEYRYTKMNASIFKRFELSILGHANIELSAGKVFGTVPYVLLHIPRANQTYAYQTNAYNLMNFIEFAGDQYINLNLRHYFKGFFFNKIPLLKKLKWREVFSAKMVWGSLADKNNPNLRPELLQFSANELGQQTTYALSGKPYVELGVGISNIFKFVRVDLVQRMTYLDHPNVPTLFNKPGLGVRIRLDAEF